MGGKNLVHESPQHSIVDGHVWAHNTACVFVFQSYINVCIQDKAIIHM